MRKRELASGIAAFVAVLVAILGVGGAFRWVQAIVAVLVALAIAPILLSRRINERRSPLVILVGAAALLTAFQLVPVPEAIMALANPTGAALREDGAVLMGTAPWTAVTLDASSTLRALCFLVIVLGVAIAATRLSVTERGRYRVLAGIGAACGLTAVIVGLHELLGASSLYGIYEPVQARPSILGPLLNENHLGGLMAIGTTVALGLALHGTQPSRLRATWLVVAASCGAAAVASQSRGAVLALIGGLLVTGGVYLAQRLFRSESHRGRVSFATTSLPIALVATATMVVVLYASAGGVGEQFARTSFDEIEQPRSKVAIWRSTIGLIQETPWVGVGRGAFEPAFTRHHPAAALNSFSHVENEYIQAVVDWGVPGALLLGVLAAWLLAACVRRWRDGPLAAAALGALAIVGIQSAVDFGIELLGVAVPAAAVVATLTYVPLREVDGRRLKLARVTGGLLVLALVASALLLCSEQTGSLAESHARLARDPQVDLAALTEHAERHPLDYYVFARAAEVSMRSSDPRAVRLLNHALRLHPTQPALHQLAARTLLRAGRSDQAAIEYSLAMRSAPRLEPLLSEITTRLPVDLAARAIPTDSVHVAPLAKSLRDLGRADVATRWLIRVLELRAENLEACEWLYAAAVRSRDMDAGVAAVEHCARAAPSFDARVALARLLVSNQRPAAAMQILHDVESWRGRVDTKIRGWLTLCDAYIAAEQIDDAQRCLRRLGPTQGMTSDRRRELTKRLEQIESLVRTPPAVPSRSDPHEP